jgi:hypothetical protein
MTESTVANPADRAPRIMFIGPTKHRVKHRLTVFLIEEKDEAGSPKRLRLLKDNEAIGVVEGMEFMTGYVPAHMLKVE